MIPNKNRKQDISKFDKLLKNLSKYVYIETIIIIGTFLLIGYITNPNDICFLHHKTPYLLILIAFITLFHGFESAFLTMTIISFSMWYFYQQFPYADFLIMLLMAMLFSEFHYYWTTKIRELRIDNDYKSLKLNEVSKAFYTLRISHDQLEKNYVLKPMSIRNAIEKIKKQEPAKIFSNFLFLLEKSFSLSSGFIVYKNDIHDKEVFTTHNAIFNYTSTAQHYAFNDITDDYLVDKAFNFKQPIYISDLNSNPDSNNHQNSKFLAVLPAIYNDVVVALLVIEEMPFMAFNQENLTSIAILLEYISIGFHKKSLLSATDEMIILKDKEFRYEYLRLRHLYQQYKINSTFLILKIHSELQAYKVHERIIKLLRSLDLVTMTHYKDFYYLIILFPINSPSVASGFLDRLKHNLQNEKDQIFESIIFDIKKPSLVLKYITDEYNA